MKKEQIKKMIEIALSQLAYSYTLILTLKWELRCLERMDGYIRDAILKMRLIHRQTVRSVPRFSRQSAKE